MSELALLGIACLALLAALLLSTPRWPTVAWSGALLMVSMGIVWPATVYLLADQPAGPFSAAAWPEGAVGTVHAWVGLLVSDVVGFIALALVLLARPQASADRSRQ